jgi:rRNA-processing protein FCF1
MKRILLDTNFLVSLMRFRVELEEIGELLVEPYKLLTTSSVVMELKKIGSKNAKLALKLIELKSIGVLGTKEKNADRAILSLAGRDTIIATNDAKLRKKLKALGSKTIYLRARKHLATS